MADSDKDSQELAEDRTDWAEDRTLLANERTFAGWMRTGMASAAIGLGLNAIFGKFEPTWIAKLGASVFLVIALGIFFVAWRSSCKLHDRLNAHAADPVSGRHFGQIAGALSFGIVILGAILWVL